MKAFIESIKNALHPYYNLSEADFIAYNLVEKFCSVSKIAILSGKDLPISAQQELQIQEAIKDLQKYKPLQYVLGEAFFYGNYFDVSPAVLIPRPETEELVSKTAKILEKQCPQAHILDVGTGSGCIAISLALALPQAKLTALDLSEEALQIAKKNAKKLKVEINFIQADILTWKNEKHLLWDCIISNPPYVCENEKSTMQKNVLDYEPTTALFVPDAQPLLFYEKIILFAKKYLRQGGFLFFEINEKFGEEIAFLLQKNDFAEIVILQDFYGKDRFAKAQKKS
ncbi:MAG: peptide chain release factor N(5)-glutamine methyltransferase [Raineya sp.]